MRAIANNRGGSGRPQTVRFQRVVSAPLHTGPRPAGEFNLRGGSVPIYRTSNTRVATTMPAEYRRRPRLVTFTLVLVVLVIAFSVAAGRVLIRSEDRPNTAAMAVFGPTIEELMDGPVALASPGVEAAFKPIRADAPVPPPVSASAYILVDLDTGATQAVRDARARLPVASLTKIATAMTALRLSGAREPVTVSIDAARAEPNRMGIIPGETLTVEELLYGLLLDSGNDAAAALAESLGGEEHFVAAMNELATELGLADTHFANPAGFDGPDNYSSAYDMAVLGRRLVIDQPLLAQIVATPSHVIESNPGHGWFGPTNLNRLLTEYPGAFGVKTGRTRAAGYTLIAAAQRDGRRLLVVVLGSEHHFDDAAILLDFGFSVIEPMG